VSAARALADEFVTAILDKLESDPATARRLRAALSIDPTRYSQMDLPPGMSKRAYLRHCARRDWPSHSEGRLRITMRSDFLTWAASRKSALRAPDVQIQDPGAYLAALGATPAKRKAR